VASYVWLLGVMAIANPREALAGLAFVAVGLGVAVVLQFRERRGR
jgi:hypothetical protein